MGSGVVRIARHLIDCTSGLPPSLMLAPPSMFEPGYFHSERVSMRLTLPGGLARAGPRSRAAARTAAVAGAPRARIVRSVRMVGHLPGEFEEADEVPTRSPIGSRGPPAGASSSSRRSG